MTKRSSSRTKQNTKQTDNNVDTEEENEEEDDNDNDNDDDKKEQNQQAVDAKEEKLHQSLFDKENDSADIVDDADGGGNDTGNKKNKSKWKFVKPSKCAAMYYRCNYWMLLIGDSNGNVITGILVDFTNSNDGKSITQAWI